MLRIDAVDYFSGDATMLDERLTCRVPGPTSRGFFFSARNERNRKTSCACISGLIVYSFYAIIEADWWQNNYIINCTQININYWNSRKTTHSFIIFLGMQYRVPSNYAMRIWRSCRQCIIIRDWRGYTRIRPIKLWTLFRIVIQYITIAINPSCVRLNC